MYLPVTQKEIQNLGWDAPDIILVTGDTYIDSPYIGVAVIGRSLESAGYRVAVIAQPDMESASDIARLGSPKLFWGVTAGSVDSMVANYTPSGKPRRSDDFTPGGENNRRPDRASIQYVNLIRRFCKPVVPIVVGGIESSLRRIAHYDFKDNKVRKSILLDAKADILVYGMGEKTVVELADRLKCGEDWHSVRGICYIANAAPEDTVMLPSFAEVAADKQAFLQAFKTFYDNSNVESGQKLCQQQDARFVVQNPPQILPTVAELDAVFELEYEYDVHPYYKAMGEVKALETIRFSAVSHRGCFGECNFCAITVHQGKEIVSRSEESIRREIRRLTELDGFKGYILDVGGPTANMYGAECSKHPHHCGKRRCLFPKICPNLRMGHQRQTRLLKGLRDIPGIKKVFVASGIRFDMVLADTEFGDEYLREITEHHVSGQLKIAPEHTEPETLTAMGKPQMREALIEFKHRFDAISAQVGKKQFLTYYLIAAHPGCGEAQMRNLKRFVETELGIRPEQAQVFTPTPSTYSTAMYYTGVNPFTGESVFVERESSRKEKQKAIVVESR